MQELERSDDELNLLFAPVTSTNLQGSPWARVGRRRKLAAMKAFKLGVVTKVVAGLAANDDVRTTTWPHAVGINGLAMKARRHRF
jgi:hypothetical protein